MMVSSIINMTSYIIPKAYVPSKPTVVLLHRVVDAVSILCLLEFGTSLLKPLLTAALCCMYF